MALTIMAMALPPALAAFTPDAPYQEAVPDFLEAISQATASVKDEGELQEIADWEAASRERLPEFLDDLLMIAAGLEENNGIDYAIEEYQAFAVKWQAIAESYPDLAELEPVLAPLIVQLVSGLPTLRANTGENPLNNFFAYYREFMETNPWSTGAFWRLPVLANSEKVASRSEVSKEKTVNGLKQIDLLSREIKVNFNGQTVFNESVKKGTVISRIVLLRLPSILHETLDSMIRNSENPEYIDIVRKLVEMADANIELALQNGIIDDCSYSFMFRKQLIGLKDTCVDSNGNVRDFFQISKFDPFDNINLDALTRLDPLTNPLVNADESIFIDSKELPLAGQAGNISSANLTKDQTNQSSVLSDTLPTSAAFSVAPAANGPASTGVTPLGALMGLLAPAYLWSIAGYARFL